MNYREDKYGNKLSILGFGCMRFQRKLGNIDFEKAEHQIMLAIEGGVNYFDTRINFTKTEAMILRYLIRSYPLPKNAESILKYSFRPSRTPEPASIRTHISIMNKKLEAATGRRMIILEPGRGYLITTPEYAKIKAER